MPSTAYTALTRDELKDLLAPGAEDTARAWDRLAGGFHSLLKLRSITYPKPLVPEEYARQEIAHSLEELRDTRLYHRALENAQALEEIERRFHEQGPSSGLHGAVDDFIEALLEEWDAIRFYPDRPPPVSKVSRDPGEVYQRRAAGAD